MSTSRRSHPGRSEVAAHAHDARRPGERRRDRAITRRVDHGGGERRRSERVRPISSAGEPERIGHIGPGGWQDMQGLHSDRDWRSDGWGQRTRLRSRDRRASTGACREAMLGALRQPVPKSTERMIKSKTYLAFGTGLSEGNGLANEVAAARGCVRRRPLDATRHALVASGARFDYSALERCCSTGGSSRKSPKSRNHTSSDTAFVGILWRAVVSERRSRYSALGRRCSN